MDYSGITLFKFMQAKMAYHAQRQDELARNVANIDTPGFQPKDLKPLDFERLASLEARRLKVRATNPQHITDIKRDNEGVFRSQKMRKTYETTPVDNAVVLEEQMMHIAENQMEYQKVSNLYNKVSGLFKTAINNK